MEKSDFAALLKPRVMILVVFTALVGIIAAPVYVHPFTIFVSIVFIALGGGASGALNMWYDADIDRLMRRTQNRPIPAGKITSNEAKVFGIVLTGISVVMLGLAANWFVSEASGAYQASQAQIPPPPQLPTQQKRGRNEEKRKKYGFRLLAEERQDRKRERKS